MSTSERQLYNKDSFIGNRCGTLLKQSHTGFSSYFDLFSPDKLGWHLAKKAITLSATSYPGNPKHRQNVKVCWCLNVDEQASITQRTIDWLML